MSLGSHLTDYNSLVVLTHFKGHTQGGFGGSNKNIGIVCADGRIGKAWIHTTPGQDDQWDIKEEEFMERIESRHGLRQLSYMKELGMGNDRYVLIDLDNGGRRITAAEAVRGLKPFKLTE